MHSNCLRTKKLLILYINGLMIFTCIPYRHTSLWRTYVVVLICTVSGAVLQVRIQIESDAMTCLHTERFVDVPVDPRDMGPVQPLMLFVHRIVFQSDVNRGGWHTPTKKKITICDISNIIFFDLHLNSQQAFSKILKTCALWTIWFGFYLIL